MAGHVLVETQRRLFLPPHRRRVGVVFQDARLFPHLTVAQNLAYGRVFARLPHDRAEFAAVTGMLGIEKLLTRSPPDSREASANGSPSAVRFWRRPRLLLMDEPLAALDDARKAEILPYIERLRDEAGVPIVYVSHSVAEVARLAATLVVLDGAGSRRPGPPRRSCAGRTDPAPR